jgi:hypothetical protein
MRIPRTFLLGFVAACGTDDGAPGGATDDAAPSTDDGSSSASHGSNEDDDGPTTAPGTTEDGEDGAVAETSSDDDAGDDGGASSDGGLPGTCTVADTSGCVAGSTLSFVDETWTCDQPLSNYGTLPLRVELDFTDNSTDFGVRLDTGCTGDGDPETIDLILDVRGDGQTYGTFDDAVRTTNALPGPTDLQITGHADCGKKQGGAHQDGLHAIGGTDITFVDFTIGDYEGGLATCMAAGGVVFYSGAGSVAPQNLHIVRGEYIGCNHALLNGNRPNDTGSATDAKFRSGRNFTNGGEPGLCQDGDGGPYYASDPCIVEAPGFPANGLVCERWDGASGSWVAQ